MPKAALDALDQAIIAALEGNIRLPTRAVAEAVGATPATVKRRLDRLQGEQIITLSPLVDLRAAGYEYLLIIGIRVKQLSPYRVAEQLGEIPAALTANVTLGTHDIELVAAARDREEASRLLAETLPAIEGIASLEAALSLDVWKFRSGVLNPARLSPKTRPSLLDALDRQIIQSLRHSARKSNRAIAAEIGISETAVRNRLSRMQNNKQLNFEHVWKPLGQKDIAAFVGIDVNSGDTLAVCQALAKIDSVSFVTTALGRHNIFCTINVDNLESLTRVLHERIIPIPGILNTRPSHCLDQVIHQLELGFIL